MELELFQVGSGVVHLIVHILLVGLSLTRDSLCPLVWEEKLFLVSQVRDLCPELI